MKKRMVCFSFLVSLIFVCGAGKTLYADNKRVIKQPVNISKAIRHYNTGKQYLLITDYSKARQQFELAKQLDQSEVGSVYRLSEMYLEKIDELEEAEGVSAEMDPALIRQRIEGKMQRTGKKKKVHKIEMQESKKRDASERIFTKADKKQKTETKRKKESDIPPQVRQKIEISQRYYQARKYFQQGKFEKAITEFQFVKSKIRKSHPYSIPCLVYIEKAKRKISERNEQD